MDQRRVERAPHVQGSSGGGPGPALLRGGDEILGWADGPGRLARANGLHLHTRQRPCARLRGRHPRRTGERRRAVCAARMATTRPRRHRRARRQILCRHRRRGDAPVRCWGARRCRTARALHRGLWPVRPCGSDAAGAVRSPALAARTVPRADAGVQGCRAAVARAAVRKIPEQSRHRSDRRRRDVGRHRLGGDRCAGRARQCRAVHAPPAGGACRTCRGGR